MATQITCIVPDSSSTPDRRIDGVGGDGWTKGEDEVIAEIEEGAEYYVEVDERRTPVEVEETDEGLKFLKTRPDDFPPNNLMSLPHCEG